MYELLSPASAEGDQDNGKIRCPGAARLRHERLASIKLQLDMLDCSHDETAEGDEGFELSQMLREQWLTADYVIMGRSVESLKSCFHFHPPSCANRNRRFPPGKWLDFGASYVRFSTLFQGSAVIRSVSCTNLRAKTKSSPSGNNGITGLSRIRRHFRSNTRLIAMDQALRPTIELCPIH
jgi:hypothetical protein